MPLYICKINNKNNKKMKRKPRKTIIKCYLNYSFDRGYHLEVHFKAFYTEVKLDLTNEERTILEDFVSTPGAKDILEKLFNAVHKIDY